MPSASCCSPWKARRNPPDSRSTSSARTDRPVAEAHHGQPPFDEYEQVAVCDVAREAEVSEQTVCNYFQTKEQLVTDRDQLVQDALSRRIRMRAPGTTPAAAIREFVLDTVGGSAAFPPAVARRARLPGRHQPDHPLALPGYVRPPGQRPRRRHY